MVERVRNGAPSGLNCAGQGLVGKNLRGRPAARSFFPAAALALSLVGGISIVGSPLTTGFASAGEAEPPTSQVVAQQATPCINGWRTIHLVQRGGDYWGGVVVRCNTG